MRILMLGNSFTAHNNLPQMVAKLTGAEVASNTRGGARLAEQLNTETELGSRTVNALHNEEWDYVVLQEMSNAPALNTEKFYESAMALCNEIKANGAVPVFYATWAYERSSEPLEKTGFSYDEMYKKMSDAYDEVAKVNGALIAEVGKAFYELADEVSLYETDGSHPNITGSVLAAKTIADTILNYNKI